MGEPTLSWTNTATTYTDSANGAVELFAYRGGYLAESQNTLYNAWTTWAATSGSGDQQAIESTYSGYAFTTWIDTNGMPYIAT